jgi:hypothetical protein
VKRDGGVKMTAKLVTKEKVNSTEIVRGDIGVSRSEEAVNTPLIRENGRPDPEWVRGKCPVCGDDLVSNLYYVGGKGYLVRWECWASLGESPNCEYSRVL